MKLRILSIAAALFVAAWTHNAQATVSTTDILWTGTCLDCVQGDTQSGFEDSPAAALITVSGTPNPVGPSSFFGGDILGISYVSELFAFPSTSIDSGSFLDLFGPLPTVGDSVISGAAEFSVIFGEGTGSPVPGFFLLDTLPNGEWFLCADGSPCEGGEFSPQDFGIEASFGVASVPEPSALAIVGFGLLGLAAARRRQRMI